MLIGLNTALALYREVPESTWTALTSVENVVTALLVVGLLGLLVARFARNVSVLAKLEPQFKKNV